MPLKRLSMLAIAAAVTALVVAGCGSSDGSSTTGGGGGSTSSGSGGAYGGGSKTNASAGGGGAETIKLGVDPGGALKFDKPTLEAKAGKVTIDLNSPSSATAPHAVEVEGNGVEQASDTIEPGNSTSVTIDNLKPGTYEFYCPVDGHKQAGMKGTLTVK
jgi:uncharacterized cupredoxin-like copper-binding protein